MRLPAGTPARLLVGAGLAITAAGCESIFGPDAPDLGGHAPVVTSFTLSDFDFAPDNRTVYYIEMDPSGRQSVAVRAVDGLTGRNRMLVASLPGSNGMTQSIRAPRGSSDVYVTLTQDIGCSPATLSRIPASGGGAETVATDVRGGRLAASSNGARVAFVAEATLDPVTATCPALGDSLVVVQIGETGASGRRPVEPALSADEAQPIALSDGGDVVYLRGSLEQGAQTYSLRVASADGELVREIPLPTQPGWWPSTTISPDVMWQGGNPRVLVATNTPGTREVTIVEHDVATGASTDLGSVPPALFIASPLARSADGAVWAVWFAVENLTPNAVERPVLRYALYVGRSGGDPRSILEFASDEGPWGLRPSPDGQRVAFRYRGGLYVIPV